MIFHTAGYGVTMGSLASTAANYMGGVRPDVVAYALMGGGKKRRGKGTGKGKGRGRGRGRAARATRRVRRALSPRRSRSRSPRRVARSAARSPRRAARATRTARRVARSAARSPRRATRATRAARRVARSPRRATRAARRVARSAARSPRRVARRASRTTRRVARRASTARRDDRRPDVRRRPEVQRIPKGERKERLKQRLSERRTRRSIIKDIESGKPEQARKKMKTLSADPTRQSSMNSFLAGIESGSMPTSTLRLPDKPKKKKTTKSQFESARKKLKQAIPSSLSDSSIRYSDMSSSEAFRHA